MLNFSIYFKLYHDFMIHSIHINIYINELTNILYFYSYFLYHLCAILIVSTSGSLFLVFLFFLWYSDVSLFFVRIWEVFMRIIHKKVSVLSSYSMERIAPLDQLLFFDIETTGFSPASSSLYLIGMLSFEDGYWNLTQLFAESLSDEQMLLETFFQILAQKKLLIHFNGDMFDIPYITKCAAQYGILAPFSSIESFDIYKKIKPLKSLLGLSSLKQTSIEQFLCLTRKDPFDGGQLIPVYQEYLRTRDERGYYALLLHNEEDVLQMPKLLSILSYYDVLKKKSTLVKDRINVQDHILTVVMEQTIVIPRPIHYEFDCFSFKKSTADQQFLTSFPSSYAALDLKDSEFSLSIPIFHLDLKHFYEDYKNYFYLPEEDTAIHKKVAVFVDKDHRINARKCNCYTRRLDDYLPNPSPTQFPVFLPAYRSKLFFTPYQEKPSFLQPYIHQFLERQIGI